MARPERSYCCWGRSQADDRLEQLVFFVRGESECTREKARGQSNIFGAIEENDKEKFWPKVADQVVGQRCVVAGGSAVVFEFCQRGNGNLVEWAAGMSTGCAQEMQSES